MDSNLSKQEQVNQIILDAAQSLFLSKGFSGTSMRDIAREAGYRSVAGLYNHFSEKEEIFATLLRTRHPYDEIFNLVQSVQGNTILELIPIMFKELTGLFQRNQEFFRLVLIDYLEFEAAHIHEILNDFQEMMVTVSSRLFTLTDLDERLEPLAVIRVMAIQVLGYAITSNILPDVILDALSQEEWQQQIVSIIVRGLRKQEGN